MADDWLFELFPKFEELNNTADAPRLFDQLLKIYGLKTIAYLGTGISRGKAHEPFVATTYPLDWVVRYRGQSYVDIDPVVQIGLRRMLPIDWRQFSTFDAQVRSLFGEAAEFGLGRQGLSIPVHGRHGDRALFSITSDLSDREWDAVRRRYIRDFQALAVYVHAMVLRLHGEPERVISLSPREAECLRWVAEGKTAWECSVILGLSMHTVRCYLESARHKLGASSNTHAVAKAIKADLLSDIL